MKILFSGLVYLLFLMNNHNLTKLYACLDSVRGVDSQSGRIRTKQSCPDFHCPCPPTSALKCVFTIFLPILNLFKSFTSENKNQLFSTMKPLFDGSEKSSCTTKNNMECIFLTFLSFFSPQNLPKKSVNGCPCC